MRTNRSLVQAAAVLASVLLLLVATVAPVAARTELFTVAIDLDEGGAGEEFASDHPNLCEEGDAITDFEFPAGNFEAAGSFHLTKLIECGDGTFVIRVDAGTNFVTGGGTTGGWSVVPGSGTGAYEGIRGGGSVVGLNVDDEPFDLVDHYYGRLTF
jgi:hypothetical protein